MKYKQFEHIEAKWKRQYVIKKHQEGESVTLYEKENDVIDAIRHLYQIEQNSEAINQWIEQYLHPSLTTKLNQTIRARRKRYHDATDLHTRKKSIDLNFRVWEKLSQRSQELNCTLSETIEFLLKEALCTEKANKKVDVLRESLSQLLE